MPDVSARDNPGLVVAKNCIPAASCYYPALGQSEYGSALDATCRGAISAKDTADNTFNFAGTASKLYKLDSASWSDVSVGGGYSTASDGQWEFAQFGTRIIATNYDDDVQSWVMGTSTAFADLAGSPPKAKHIGIVRNFVVLGDTNDGVGGHVNNRVWWSGLNDATTWAASQTTQAGNQELAGGGKVMAVVGGEYGTIFMEDAIYRMTYVGAPLVWQFDQIESGRGAVSAKGCIKNGNSIAYVGIDGFYMFDGSQSIAIGSKQVNNFFWEDIDPNYIDKINGIYDPYRELLIWSYVSLELGGTTNNRLIIFNRAQNADTRWTIIDETLETLFLALSEGYNLDNASSTGYDVDSSPYGPDSSFWVGKKRFLAGFNSSHKMVTFDGTAKTAVFETGDYDLSNNGSRTQITRARPAVDGSTATITLQLGTKNVQNESITYTSAVPPNADGFCDFRTNARYHRAKMTIADGFECAYGMELISTATRGVR